MKLTLLVALIMGLLFCQNALANEETTPSWDKRFTIRGGAIAYDMSGKFSSTKDGRRKNSVDMDDLDLEEDELAYTVGANLRLGQRWHLRFDYFRYRDTATTAIQKELEYEDLIVPIGGKVDSKLNIDLYVVNLSYDLYRSKRARFGLGIGAHIADLDLEVSGQANVAGTVINLGEGEEDLTAPLPNLYASGIYAFRDDLLFNYGAGWMSLTYGDYDGDLIFARGALEYWPHKNFGLGAGYSYISVDVDYDPGHKKETYDVDMPGPLVYLIVGF